MSNPLQQFCWGDLRLFYAMIVLFIQFADCLTHNPLKIEQCPTKAESVKTNLGWKHFQGILSMKPKETNGRIWHTVCLLSEATRADPAEERLDGMLIHAADLTELDGLSKN